MNNTVTLILVIIFWALILSVIPYNLGIEGGKLQVYERLHEGGLTCNLGTTFMAPIQEELLKDD